VFFLPVAAGPEKDGTLIYIKPGLYTGDYFPRDVYNYAHTSRDFPHEPTADQFFSESQFESYRALGYYIVDSICRGGPVTDLDTLQTQVCTYLGKPGGNPASVPDC